MVRPTTARSRRHAISHLLMKGELLMRKIIEFTLVSIDGVFSGPGIAAFMSYRDDAYLRDGLGQLLACDAMLTRLYVQA